MVHALAHNMYKLVQVLRQGFFAALSVVLAMAKAKSEKEHKTTRNKKKKEKQPVLPPYDPSDRAVFSDNPRFLTVEGGHPLFMEFWARLTNWTMVQTEHLAREKQMRMDKDKARPAAATLAAKKAKKAKKTQKAKKA